MHSALVRGASDNVTCALVKVRQEQTEFEAYRQYGEIHIEQLEFVLRAKMVGFTLDECKSLVELAT